jgi:hypothetical protein
MTRRPLRAATAALACVLVASACSGEEPAPTSEEAFDRAQSKHLATVTDKDLDAALFHVSNDVDNKWLPLRPGTQFVYEGGVTEDGERLSHRVIFTVTDLTKVINGVHSIVLWDRDYTDGHLVEAELAYFAQDNDGNVWNMGEYPEEYDEGTFEGAPDTWLAGLSGAQAGIMMRANPQAGTPGYFQGLVPAIEFADRAKIFKMGEKTCVPVDCYDDVLVTDEWDPSEAGAHQLKYYAPGVGNVRVGWAGAKEKEKETLALAKLVELSPEALAAARAEAEKLEARAYEVQNDLFRHTLPAQRLEAQ